MCGAADAKARSATVNGGSILPAKTHLLSMYMWILKIYYRKPPLSRYVLSTVPLNNFRVRTDGVQENQMHCDVSCNLKVPNLDFQPIPQLSKFYSIAT